MLQEFPTDEVAKNRIITNLYERSKERERNELVRLQQVIDLIAGDGCISRNLAKHFGDESFVPKTGCGHCSFCHTKKPIQFSRDLYRSAKGCIDDRKFLAVLAATPIRDDPLFLARVAFGVRSPRITAQKLEKMGVFGSMDEYDFEACEHPSFGMQRGTDVFWTAGASRIIRQGVHTLMPRHYI